MHIFHIKTGGAVILRADTGGKPDMKDDLIQEVNGVIGVDMKAVEGGDRADLRHFCAKETNLKKPKLDGLFGNVSVHCFIIIT